MGLSKGIFVRVIIHSRIPRRATVVFGIIEGPGGPPSTYNVYLAPTLLMHNLPEMLLQRIPSSLIRVARQRVHEGLETCAAAMQFALVGTSAVITTHAASGLAGGAALMNGLANISLTGTAVGGIMTVATVPVLLTGAGIHKLVSAHENCTVTPKVAAAGSLVGGGCTVASMSTVVLAEAGSVAGLSGPGITTGLAALGGGSAWAGVAAIAVTSVGVGLLAGIAVGMVTHEIRQAVVEKEYGDFMQEMQDLNYRIL